MKVLIINTFYFPYVLGGAERSVQLLSEQLSSGGIDVVVLCTSPKRKENVLYRNGVRIYPVKVTNLYNPAAKKTPFLKLLVPFWHILDSYNPFMAQKIASVIDNEQPDIIHTNNLGGFSVSTWLAAKKYGLPILHTLRDYYLMCPKCTMFKKGKTCHTQCWYCRFYSIIRKQLSLTVDGVVGNSNYILKRHLNLGYFKHSKIKEVVYSGHSIGHHRNWKPESVSKPLRLGFIGRLKPNKGIDLLLRTFIHLSKMECQLLVAGRDELGVRNKYNLPNVHFLGFTGPEEFFSKIDVLVVPSIWHDPLPRNIFEAFAYGIPVIGSNRGGIPEVIQKDGAGFVFDPEKPKSLLKLIKKLENDRDLLHNMKCRAASKSIKYSLNNSARLYCRLYEKAINER